MKIMARSHSEPGSCPDGPNPSVSGHSACDPSREWQPIATAPRDGSWVWGEWPEIAGSNFTRGYPRIVAPMRWGKPYRGSMYADHWCMEGRWTPGPSPDRWLPINAPPPQGMEARSAETSGSARKGDSPVGEADAPIPSPTPEP